MKEKRVFNEALSPSLGFIKESWEVFKIFINFFGARWKQLF